MTHNLQTELEGALSLFQNNHLELAQQQLEELLKRYSLPQEQCHIFHLLGLIYFSRQQFEESLAYLKQTLPYLAYQPNIFNNIGLCLLALRREQQANQCFEQALHLLPDYLDARDNLARSLYNLGQYSQALPHYLILLTHSPEQELLHYQLGVIYQQTQQDSAAIEAYQKALTLNPEREDSHHNLGLIYYRQGDPSLAQHYYQQALTLNPINPAILNSLGILFLEQGDYTTAADYFRQALALLPSFPEALMNLGNAYRQMDQLNESISCYQETIKLMPDYALAHFNLGTSYHQLGQFEAALEAFKQASQLNPSPVNLLRYATLLPIIYQNKQQPFNTRQRLIHELHKLAQTPLSLTDPFAEKCTTTEYLIYQCQDDKALQILLAQIYLNSCPILQFQSPYPPKDLNLKKIKIGFISSYFYDHTISKLTRGLMANLSREKFEVYTIDVGNKQDGVTVLIQEQTEHFVRVERHLATAQQAIADLTLDLLFYCDIGMDPFTYFLAFARLAPRQCVTWGHPVTTGLPTMDYFFSSTHLEADEPQQYYTEQLILMEHLLPYFYQPSLKQPLLSRADFSLPADKTIYLCPQTLYKFHPDFDDILKGILEGDPNGVLVLIEGKAKNQAKLLSKRFQETMPRVTKQIIFLPFQPTEQFFHLLCLSDLILDSYPYGGGNSSYEAFAFNKPIITLPTQFLSGRITYALYQQMGITDCIAYSKEEYIELALKFGQNKELRATLSHKISQASSKIFENMACVKEFEAKILSLLQAK